MLFLFSFSDDFSGKSPWFFSYSWMVEEGQKPVFIPIDTNFMILYISSCIGFSRRSANPGGVFTAPLQKRNSRHITLPKIPVSMMEDIFILIEESNTVDDMKAFSGLMKRIEILLESERSICLIGWTTDNRFLDFDYLLNISFPQEWVDLYTTEGYHRIDPILEQPFQRFSPQLWSETYSRSPGLDQGFLCRSRDFKLFNGITHCMRYPQGNIGSLFSFSKESGEISVILGISERTVKFHVTNILIKLDATTRTQAMVIALKTGILHDDPVPWQTSGPPVR